MGEAWLRGGIQGGAKVVIGGEAGEKAEWRRKWTKMETGLGVVMGLEGKHIRAKFNKIVIVSIGRPSAHCRL